MKAQAGDPTRVLPLLKLERWLHYPSWRALLAGW